jgi:hypothetical protein
MRKRNRTGICNYRMPPHFHPHGCSPVSQSPECRDLDLTGQNLAKKDRNLAGSRPCNKASNSRGFTPTNVRTPGRRRYFRNKRVVIGQNWTSSIPGRLTGIIFMRMMAPRISSFAAPHINKSDLSKRTIRIFNGLDPNRGCWETSAWPVQGVCRPRATLFPGFGGQLAKTCVNFRFPVF